MKKIFYLLFTVLILATLVLTACGSKASPTAAEDQGTPPDETVPAQYAGKTNPVAGNAAAIAAGQKIYTDNCASCHGDQGKGDGPAGAALDPKPEDLQASVAENEDDFLFWRIAEGGAMAPFNSKMPAWKGTLTDDQIWQVVAFIHTLK